MRGLTDIEARVLRMPEYTLLCVPGITEAIVSLACAGRVRIAGRMRDPVIDFQVTDLGNAALRIHDLIAAGGGV